MPDPNPNPAPNDGSANPGGGDWKSTFGTDAATALESFKEPGEFFKSYQTLSGELKTLKEKPPEFDWRKAASGGDEKLTGLLGRFTDLGALGKAYAEAQGKIRSGELAKPLPENATPEQKAEWRAANGIPDKPEDYFAKLPDGLVIGKDDEGLFKEVATELHELNAPPAVLHKLVGWYYKMSERETAAVAEADKKHAREATDTLRQDWGPDYRGNISHVMSFLDGMGKDMKAQFMDATLPDGRRMFNSPDVIKWLAGVARDVNPAGVLTPNAGENQMQSIDSEIAGIEKTMRENRQSYNKDENLQKRYMQLLEAREKLKSRAA